jgi:hypothetical protein
MICVVHSVEMAPGDAAQHMIELGKKLFKHEKETFGHDVIFMRATTGKTNRVIIAGFHESHAAHEEYVKKVSANSERQEIIKKAGWKSEAFMPGSWETTYYNVIE